MRYRERFYDLGSTYTIVEARDHRRAQQPVDPSLERVPRHEARWVLAKVVRREPQVFARLCERLLGIRLATAGAFTFRTVGNTDALIAKMLDAFGVHRLTDEQSAATDFARFYLLRSRRGDRAPSGQPESPEGRRIAQALVRLGGGTFSHRGATYCLQRAGRADVPLANRESYETLSEAQLFAVLSELSSEPALEANKQAVLKELLAAAEDQRAKTGTTELLLLRLQRFYARAESAGPAITPAQMRKALERHWIEIAAVDPDGKPVSEVAVELQLADGSIRSATTDADGFARVEPVPVGSTTIRLPKIDGGAWRPLGGAGASPSSARPASRTHVVKQGECLSKIAHRYGVADWKTIWEHADNAKLRQRRKSPHVLHPKDRLSIPGIQVCEIVRAADATHRIEIKGSENTIDLTLLFRDDEGNGLANEPYELYLDDAKQATPGQLDGSGQIKEKVPLSAQRVTLLFPQRKERYELAVSHLDPLEDEPNVFVRSGVAARLRALGYMSTHGDIDDEALRGALLDFQREVMGKTDASGELDAATCQKLEEAYGV